MFGHGLPLSASRTVFILSSCIDKYYFYGIFLLFSFEIWIGWVKLMIFLILYKRFFFNYVFRLRLSFQLHVWNVCRSCVFPTIALQVDLMARLSLTIITFFTLNKYCLWVGPLCRTGTSFSYLPIVFKI